MFLRSGFTATGVGERGAVRLVGARIGGSLDCSGAALRNDSGPALFADGLQVDLDMQCDRLTADGQTGLCSAVTSADSLVLRARL